MRLQGCDRWALHGNSSGGCAQGEAILRKYNAAFTTLVLRLLFINIQLH